MHTRLVNAAWRARLRANVGTTILVASLVFLSIGAVPGRAGAQGTESLDSSAGLFFYGMFEDGHMQDPTSLGEMIQDVKAHALDSIVFTNTTPSSFLDVADGQGVKIVAAPHDVLNPDWWHNSGVTVDLPTAESIASPIISSLASHPSLFGYNLVDDGQPEWTDKILMMSQAFRELDPSHAALGFYPSSQMEPDIYRSHASRPGGYLTYQYPVEVGMANCNFTRWDHYTKDFVDQLRETTQKKPANMPLWVVLQTHSTVDDPDHPQLGQLRYPTVEEVRLQNWLALGEGTKGIAWFIYSTQQTWLGVRDNPALYAEVAALAQRIGPLKPTLARLTKTPDEFHVTATGKAYVSTLTDRASGARYVIAANHTCSPQSLTIDSWRYTGQLKDLETGQLYPLGTLISFLGGDGKMFQLVNFQVKSRAQPPALAPNLVSNSSFETGADGYPVNWSNNSLGTWDQTQGHTGHSSLKANPGGFTYTWQGVMIQPNTHYTLSYWSKTQNVHGSGVGIRYPQTAMTTVILGDEWMSSNSDWTRTMSYFTTPVDYADGRLDLEWNLDSGDTAWIDDVAVCVGYGPCQGDGPVMYPPPPR